MANMRGAALSRLKEFGEFIEGTKLIDVGGDSGCSPGARVAALYCAHRDVVFSPIWRAREGFPRCPL